MDPRDVKRVETNATIDLSRRPFGWAWHTVGEDRQRVGILFVVFGMSISAFWGLGLCGLAPFVAWVASVVVQFGAAFLIGFSPFWLGLAGWTPAHALLAALIYLNARRL